MKQSNKHPLYNRWRHIRQVTTNPNNLEYAALSKFKEPLFEEFETFVHAIESTIGPCPRKRDVRLCRINHKKGWTLDNVDWGNSQLMGSRFLNRVPIKFQGQSLFLHEWSDLLGIKMRTLYSRISRGLPKKQIFHQGRLPRTC